MLEKRKDLNQIERSAETTMTEHRMLEDKNIRQDFHLVFGWLKILLLVAFLERRKRNRGDTKEAGR